jgi:RNA polymerase-associated protein LEO1
VRRLDDSDLDSGDDLDREDRAASQEEVIEVQRDEVVQPMQLPRHVVPEPDDNEVCEIL